MSRRRKPIESALADLPAFHLVELLEKALVPVTRERGVHDVGETLVLLVVNRAPASTPDRRTA
jgi:hypothetical protein